MRPEDPFEDQMQELSVSGRVVSPYAIRIPLMWKRMKEQMLALSLDSTPSVLSTEQILANMEANYIRDSYHSLSIEGYRVTERLIERVRSGVWNYYYTIFCRYTIRSYLLHYIGKSFVCFRHNFCTRKSHSTFTCHGTATHRNILSIYRYTTLHTVNHSCITTSYTFSRYHSCHSLYFLVHF